MGNAKTIINKYISALEAADYTISDYSLDYLNDPEVAFTDKLVFLKISYGPDNELSGGNVEVPLTIRFVISFESVSVIGDKAESYIDIMTDKQEAAKDILRNVNPLNSFSVMGSYSLPVENPVNFVFVEFSIDINYCHYCK
jgi:hypothetical protein